MIIEDGTGDGKSAQVDSKKRLRTLAATETLALHVNQESGKVWGAHFDSIDPTGVADYIFYFKNTGNFDLHITDFRLSQTGSTNSEYILQAVSGTPVNGTTIVPVSHTVGSTSAPTATIEQGVDITGLTPDGNLYYIDAPVPNTNYHLLIASHVIIPKGKAVALLANDASAVTTCVVSFLEAEES
jgi:hypothetical protein